MNLYFTVLVDTTKVPMLLRNFEFLMKIDYIGYFVDKYLVDYTTTRLYI